jgi:hypothetical protein
MAFIAVFLELNPSIILMDVKYLKIVSIIVHSQWSKMQIEFNSLCPYTSNNNSWEEKPAINPCSWIPDRQSTRERRESMLKYTRDPHITRYMVTALGLTLQWNLHDYEMRLTRGVSAVNTVMQTDRDNWRIVDEYQIGPRCNKLYISCRMQQVLGWCSIETGS